MPYVDPDTGDWVLEDGHFRRAPATLEQEVYFRLTIHRGTWLDDPDMGSRLWTLAQRKDATRAALEVDGMVREALAEMLDEGRVRDLTVEVTPQDRRLDIVIRLTDAGDLPYRFQLFQRVG